MGDEPLADVNQMAQAFLKQFAEHYWKPFHEKLKVNPELKIRVPSFLRHHDNLVIYFGRTHIAIEYLGSELEAEPSGEYSINLTAFDFSPKETNILEQIVGFNLGSTMDIVMPLPPYSEDLVLASQAGWEKLHELDWNHAAQEAIFGFNWNLPEPPAGQFCRLLNAKFFDANENGLITRRIQWVDFFPVEFIEGDEETDQISIPTHYWRELAENDAEVHLTLPSDYKFQKLPLINNFVELWGNSETTEPQITQFLAEDRHKFILTMRFGAQDIKAEALCKWQSEKRQDIKPDFFVVNTNGYADIVEFKLPDIGKALVVGRENRETFGAWLQSYIAQTRVYSEFFDDPNNRAWFKEQYGFKVHKPRRYLVVGRRADFAPEQWRSIAADYQDIELLNYDDLVDGVKVQFYM